MESIRKKPRCCRSFTPEFKAEIVELCQRGDRSICQVANYFDLIQTAVREWVKRAERDAGTWRDVIPARWIPSASQAMQPCYLPGRRRRHRDRGHAYRLDLREGQRLLDRGL
jgi:transposase-like protein